MYKTLTYTGGVHKHEEITELIEDLGGFVLQETISQMDLVITLAVPLEDVEKVQEKAKNLSICWQFSTNEFCHNMANQVEFSF